MFLPPRVQGMLVICVVGKDRFETGEMVRPGKWCAHCSIDQTLGQVQFPDSL